MTPGSQPTATPTTQPPPPLTPPLTPLLTTTTRREARPGRVGVGAGARLLCSGKATVMVTVRRDATAPEPRARLV